MPDSIASPVMPSPVAGAGRLYRKIAEEIRLRIADSTFAAGSRLPAERDLAHRFAVSRTSVREALIALEIGGFVEVRIGSGIYVSDPLPFIRPLFEAVDAGPGPFELLHARWLVEGEIAALAARNIDEPTLARLAEAVRVLQSPSAGARERDDADRSFHLGIAEATGNGALIQTLRMYWDQRRGPMWQKLVEHFHTPQLRAVVADDHARILDALAMRAPARARLAMRRHLLRVTREFGKERGTAAGAAKQPRSMRAGMPPPGGLRVRTRDHGGAPTGDAKQFLGARANADDKVQLQSPVFFKVKRRRLQGRLDPVAG